MKPPEMWSRKRGLCDCCQESEVPVTFIPLAFPRGLQVRLCGRCLAEALSLSEEKPHQKNTSTGKT
jgi:hypothetical protein